MRRGRNLENRIGLCCIEDETPLHLIRKFETLKKASLDSSRILPKTFSSELVNKRENAMLYLVLLTDMGEDMRMKTFFSHYR